MRVQFRALMLNFLQGDQNRYDRRTEEEEKETERKEAQVMRLRPFDGDLLIEVLEVCPTSAEIHI